MEDENFSQELGDIVSRLKPFFLSLGIACIGLIFIGYGVIMYILPHSASNEITFESLKDSASSVKSVEDDLVVDIAGGVKKPGVYHLKSGDRVTDGIQKAGGLSDSADHYKIQHSLNLAAKVSDGMKIYIPIIGESGSMGFTSSGSTTGSSSTAVAGAETTSIISINTASPSELDSLSGIGEKTAEKIINGRPYSNIDELLSKKIVGKSVFEKIKDKISL